MIRISGVIRYCRSKSQLLYLPGIIEGAEDRKGKGRQVINVARAFNLILVVLDAVQPLAYKGLIPEKILTTLFNFTQINFIVKIFTKNKMF